MRKLSKAKRLFYGKAQPQFWKYEGDAIEESQGKWFKASCAQGLHYAYRFGRTKNSVL